MTIKYNNSTFNKYQIKNILLQGFLRFCDKFDKLSGASE